MAVDLFADLNIAPEKLHPQFTAMRDSPCYAPARAVIAELQSSFHDADGNFVEQFQTTGFDSRTFEFFLFAMLREVGHDVDRTHARPDFLITREGLTAALEATTASMPSVGGIQPYFAVPQLRSEEEAKEYYANNLPIRLGSPLYSKLRVRYWLEPHVTGKPLVLAIQDFHAPGSLSGSASSLGRYLFGQEQRWYHDADGKLVISEHAVACHRAGVKEIPSGFFNQPDAENISAVLFCNAGTAPKFARMGHEGKHRAPGVRMLRFGTCYRYDPDAALPIPFVYEVGAPDAWPETWRQGTVLIRNPRALHPLPAGWFGAGVEEDLVEGKSVATFFEEFHPYCSMTKMFSGNPPTHLIQREANRIAQALAEVFPA